MNVDNPEISGIFYEHPGYNGLTWSNWVLLYDIFQKNWVLAAIMGEKSGNIIRLIRPWPSPDPSHWASAKFTARVFDAYCVASVWVRNGMFTIVYNCLYNICMNHTV